MLKAAGLIFAFLGIALGAILVLGPLGLSPIPSGPSAWVLFPLFSAIGYLFLALPASMPTVRVLSRTVGTIFAVLATVAAVGLFLTTTEFVKASTGTISQWYVLVIGLVFGAAGLTAHAPASPKTDS